MSVVHANVVTYNPDLAQLTDSLQLLLKQTDLILVVNNSPEPLDLHIEGVHILELGENLGIARAQSIAMQWSFERDADFILQMDQDSTPNDDMVPLLLKAYTDLTALGHKVGLVGPQDYDRFSGHVAEPRVHKAILVAGTHYSAVNATLSSGSLIPREAYQVVGGMMDKLFIDAVDHEYCWRLRHNGFSIYKNSEARLAHRLGNGDKKILGFIRVGVPSPFRHYYAIRNALLLLPESYVPLSWKLSSIAKIGFKLVTYPLFLDRGAERFRFIIKGIAHGLTRRSGKL
ncbi:glycosyltransferase family 2 protein [uncultured Rheinheimera sp.]|uniref:glycosyltransferase family 2 protein n=1 Tax=uncultured Rheinheimera sp. TaxID=400532 RepID=UPI0025996C65|nr:glycosyltransferase family 2 protein [uncultured Rheinheimera sp.]